MIAYGAKLGSSLLTYVLSSSLVGESRQVAMFQVYFNIAGAVILVPAFYLEVYAGIPLMIALGETFSADQAFQLAIINLLFNVVPGVVIFPCVGLVARLLARYFPQTAEEQLSKPKYLLEQTGDDPHNALRLIELEQIRLIEILSRAFDTMRAGNNPRQMELLNEGFHSLGDAVRGAISDLSNHHQLSPVLYDRLNGLLNIQHSLETANVEVQSLSRQLSLLEGTGLGERFARVAVDGIDAILLTFMDVARERADIDAELLAGMTSEDGMTRVRKAYLAEDENMDANSRMQLLAAANHCERLIWLFGDMGKAYDALGTA
jgi:phosphate:Na+ symporter